MSASGVFAVSRGVFDHAAFANEAFTEREAWIWMIGEAAWKARRVRVGSAVVELKRGQLAVSTRFAASRWQWSEARVRRFLKRLAADAMVVTQTDAHATRITICNYDEYQKVSLPSDAVATQERRTVDAPATHDRRKTESRESKEDREEGSDAIASVVALPVAAPTAPVLDLEPVYTDDRHELWGEAPIILTSLGVPAGQSRKLVGSWLKQAGDDCRSVLGAIQRAREHRPADPVSWITAAIKPRAADDRRNVHPLSRAFDSLDERIGAFRSG